MFGYFEGNSSLSILISPIPQFVLLVSLCERLVPILDAAFLRH
jgi:hypothetical protein